MENLSNSLSSSSLSVIPQQPPEEEDPQGKLIVERIKKTINKLPVNENINRSISQNISFIEILQRNRSQQEKLRSLIDRGLRERDPEKAKEISCYQEALEKQEAIIKQTMRLELGFISSST